MVTTERDRNLLLDLREYGLHTTRTIAARHFPGVAMTTVLRRLRVLEASGKIQRISGLEGGGNAWSLTKSSAQALLPAASKVHFPRFILEHDLGLVALRLRLEDVGITRSWRSEHEVRARMARKYGLGGLRERIIPDGIMGVEVQGVAETLAVELELSPKNQARYRRVFRDYATKKNLWGFWYVVSNVGIGRQLETAARASWRLADRPFFFWSVLEDVMRDPLLATVQGQQGRYRLRELWAPLPAHAPAQGVSRQEESASAEKEKLTAEEKTEILTPAS